MNYVYDLETFRAVFCAVVRHVESGTRWIFECSRRRNQSVEFMQFVHSLREARANMVGFNNEAFDYPIIHYLAQFASFTEYDAWLKAQEIIGSQDRYAQTVWPNERLVRQVDLFKIHHFDNKARSTSLKALQFNMRTPVIEEPPYWLMHAETLTDGEIQGVIDGCCRDVDETVRFFGETQSQIAFREAINPDWINFNDTKIGKQYFIDRLEQAAPGTCYDRSGGRRVPRQTPRYSGIPLSGVILPSVSFRFPEFQRVLDHFREQVITDTRDAFGTDKESKELTRATVRGLTYIFGTGGIHGSVSRQVIRDSATHCVRDIDVKSYYPNLAIANRLAPEHLGALFCDIYEQVYNMRTQYPSDAPENGMLKLALNGVYGDSNNIYSPFYDPAYTMAITINGQLLLCMLAELLMLYVPDLQVIQINTDGMTCRFPREYSDLFTDCMAEWERHTRLTLESVDYDGMWIRDVNNYLARTVEGKVKRKGAYETAEPGKRKPVGWHQDTSAIVVPRAAGRVMLEGADVLAELVDCRDPYDFAIRCKTGRDSQLRGSDGRVFGGVTRYHVARDGIELTKHFASGRTSRVEKGWRVQPCNDMADFRFDKLELRWYKMEVEKLLIMEG